MTRFDLHIHSALSACGENVMSPARIIEKAREAGLNLLAITDHNASSQVEMSSRLGIKMGITVIPAMEVTSREEAHLLAYFSELSQLSQFQELIDAHLPKIPNNPRVFGWQLIYDERENIVETDDQLRQVGVNLGMDALIEHIHELRGLAIPAHVFRPRYSLTSQLGFIDPSEDFDGLEVCRRQWHLRHLCLGMKEAGFPLITGSDSHFLEDIGHDFLEINENVTDLHELAAQIF